MKSYRTVSGRYGFRLFVLWLGLALNILPLVSYATSSMAMRMDTAPGSMMIAEMPCHHDQQTLAADAENASKSPCCGDGCCCCNHQDGSYCKTSCGNIHLSAILTVFFSGDFNARKSWESAVLLRPAEFPTTPPYFPPRQ